MKIIISLIVCLLMCHSAIAAVQCKTPLQQAELVARAPDWIKKGITGSAELLDESTAISNLDSIVISVEQRLPIDSDEDALVYVKCIVTEYTMMAKKPEQRLGVKHAKKWLLIR